MTGTVVGIEDVVMKKTQSLRPHGVYRINACVKLIG